MLRAAYEQPLVSARKTELDRLVAELDATEANKTRAIDDLKTDLAAAIRAGAIDAARMKRHEQTISSAIRAHRVKKVDALDELHAMLDGPARGAVVSAVRARLADREDGEPPSILGARGTGPTGPVDSLKHRLDLLKGELSLDAEQHKRIAGLPMIKDEERALQKIEGFRDQRRKRAEALLGAFPTDAFDAKAVVAPTSQKAPGQVTKQGVAFVSRLLAILKPEQREELASKIDEIWTFVDPLREHDGDPRNDAVR